ncbi:MAG: hypothetical protein LAQ69_07380 [Acidobacteriia bacterium]|nr:hypothetical protein [Terriglobia bacterium]
MRHLILKLAGMPAMAALLLWTPNPAAAQNAKAPAKTSSPRRMADGHPDLQGTYDLATLTPVERPSGANAVYTKEEARKLETAAALQREKGDQSLQGDRPAPPKGGDGSLGPAGNVGGYNTGWLDPGSAYTVVNGENRSSIVVDPPNGRVPPMTPAAAQRMAAARARPTSDAQENSNDPGLEKAPGAYDDPERRPLGERCLLGFGSTSGPPALPDYFYNNLHQIVQTPDAVMILTEMVHDARIVRMNAQHVAKNIRLWMGDSVGHWEGDTLVVDTTNFTAKTRFRGSTEDLHVIERFSRVDDRTLLYRFTIDDPATWSKPWTGEYTWPATDAHIYEYACHEANYALTDILKGARLRDKEQAAAKAAK